MPTINSFPPELLYLVLGNLDLVWLCKARLACKAFADAGLRFLAHSIIVARTPASFERIQFIVDHPVLRYNVKKLAYAYDDVVIGGRSFEGRTLEQKNLLDRIDNDLEQFKALGRDIDAFKLLIQNFPALQQINLESPWLTYEAAMAAVDLRLNSRSQDAIYDVVKPCDTSLLRAIDAIDAIDSLQIDWAPLAVMNIDPPRCFQQLRRLQVSFDEDTIDTFDLNTTTETPLFKHNFPMLTQLHISMPWAEQSNNDHFPLSLPLPRTLRELELEHVQFPWLDLPPNLDRLILSGCRLRSSILGWVDILATCTMDCKFSGIFFAEASGLTNNVEVWRSCNDTLLQTTIGLCLTRICSSSCQEELRIDLLKIIFDPLLVIRSGDKPLHLDVPEALAQKYHQIGNRIGKRIAI